MFVAGFTFTALREGNLRAFILGSCAGAASLSQYAAIGISTQAAAGLVVLVLVPVCGLVGACAGMFAALAFRSRKREFWSAAN